MCGIVGIWKHDGQLVASAEVEATAVCLKHRGPDDSGVYIDGSFGLGQRRLSIVDLSSGGHQPMLSRDERYALVFNGEIYNYQELRQTYFPDVTFRSQSDTEVLLQLLIAKGAEALPLLRGMFAFAFWDRQKQELLLARDAFGKKPLYVSRQKEYVAFASEVKALLAWQKTAEVDAAELSRYLLHEYVPAPASGYSGIEQLEMGQYANITKNNYEVKTWWQPSFTPKLQLTEKVALQKLDELLGQAVARRLVGDVPVGVFLSGGLDSTTIAWYVRQQTRAPLHTFSISFAEPSFNEGHYAAEAAAALDTTHHDQLFGIDQFFSSLENLQPLLDIPFADASLLPTYHMSQQARHYITVALDGDGSDELFGGYGTFQAAETLEDWQAWLELFAPLLSAAAQLLPTAYENFSFDFKVKSFLKGLGYPLARRNQIWLGSFSEKELLHLLQPTYASHVQTVFNSVDTAAKKMPTSSTLDAVSYLTIQHYLQNGILVKLDRATMAASVEARTPFLDIDVAEFAMKLPKALKRDKYLLKQLMKGRISDEIISRPKKGFGIPLGVWLRGPLRTWGHGLLAPEKLQADGFFNPAYVAHLLAEHEEGRADHRKKIWTLLMWQIWYDNWIRS